MKHFAFQCRSFSVLSSCIVPIWTAWIIQQIRPLFLVPSKAMPSQLTLLWLLFFNWQMIKYKLCIPVLFRFKGSKGLTQQIYLGLNKENKYSFSRVQRTNLSRSKGICCFIYRTRAIITRGLYIFYPIFSINRGLYYRPFMY